MCLLRQLRDTWPRQLDLVCIGADARWRNMRGPGNRKRSKQGFNTEHTEKKLKPQVTQRKKHRQCTMDPQDKPAFDYFSL
jgi:hypothetical protein